MDAGVFSAMTEREPKRFRNYLRRAELLVSSNERLRDLAMQATRKLSGIASFRIDTVRDLSLIHI